MSNDYDPYGLPTPPDDLAAEEAARATRHQAPDNLGQTIVDWIVAGIAEADAWLQRFHAQQRAQAWLDTRKTTRRPRRAAGEVAPHV